MTISRSEDLLAGIVALGIVPWVVWIIRRGLRDGNLPIGRSYIRRDERAAPYWVMLALYVCAALLMLFIALDLLFGIRSGS